MFGKRFLFIYLGANPAAPAPQQPQAPGAAQPGGQDSTKDYSQEWANYYRQIGKVDEAEAIERQIKVSFLYFFYPI